MKYFSKYLNFIFIFMMISVYSQEIVLNACNSLIEANDYTFEQISTLDGRNSFQTVNDPALGSRDCSGVGFCKLKIEWNATATRWEIIADDGNDNFSNPYVLYFNTEASLPNPPSLTLGTWIEESSVTSSQCGNINDLSGALQNSVLGFDDTILDSEFSIFPNPVKEKLYLEGRLLISDYKVSLFTILGEQVYKGNNIKSLNVSSFRTGVYFLKVDFNDRTINRKIIIK